MSNSCCWEGKAGMAHSDCGWTCGCAVKTEILWEHVPYLNASAVVIHYEEALYQVYGSLPLPLPSWPFSRSKAPAVKLSRPSGRSGSYTGLIGFNPRRLKALKGDELPRNGPVQCTVSMRNLLLLLDHSRGRSPISNPGTWMVAIVPWSTSVTLPLPPTPL